MNTTYLHHDPHIEPVSDIGLSARVLTIVSIAGAGFLVLASFALLFV